jgi:hypothetical protein
LAKIENRRDQFLDGFRRAPFLKVPARNPNRDEPRLGAWLLAAKRVARAEYRRGEAFLRKMARRAPENASYSALVFKPFRHDLVAP